MHRTKVRVAEDALDANETIARANRDDFDRARGRACVNLMSAPGRRQDDAARARALSGSTGFALGVLEGDVQGRMDADRLAATARAGDPAQHRAGLRRRVPPRREHGPLGDPGAAARRDRPAGDRERRQPRLPGRVPGRRGRAGDGLLGDRGRGQAAQVPADVPRLRAGRDQQDRPAPPPRLRPRPLPRQPRRRQPGRGAPAGQRPDRRGHRRVGRVAGRGAASAPRRPPPERGERRGRRRSSRRAHRRAPLGAARRTPAFFEAKAERLARAAATGWPSGSRAAGAWSRSAARPRPAPTPATWRSSSSTR